MDDVLRVAKDLTGIHSKDKCAGRPCVIHNPSKHHTKFWPARWRDDRKQFERVCVHSIAHPDYDTQYGPNPDMTHGCDGCCKEGRLRLVIIMQGISGSGKSTIAKMIASQCSNSQIVSADHFFFDQNEYKFDPNKLGAAHAACLSSFKKFVKDGWDVIIVDNTNILQTEAQIYIDIAQANGYDIQVVSVSSTFKNVHDVPEKVIEKQKSRLQRLVF